MSETAIRLTLHCADEDGAKAALARLKQALKAHGDDLNRALHAVHAFDDCYLQFALNVEHLARKGSAVSVSAYAGRIDPPVWFGAALAALGAGKAAVREQGDGGGRTHHFLAGRKVTKKTFDGDKPARPLAAAEQAINDRLFLPPGRVAVKARLSSFRWGENLYGSYCLMHFTTEDGQPFIYKGSAAELVRMTEDGFDARCEFVAAFERATLDGQPVAAAKRPGQVRLFRKQDDIAAGTTAPTFKDAP